MILTGSAIGDEVANGRITIRPFRNDQLNPNSYNYRLGPELYEVTSPVIDPLIKPALRKLALGSAGVLLQPNRLYLGHTMEVIGSTKYVTSLIGRSSIGRLGLFLQITADLGQLGQPHQWTLELKVVQPLRIYPGMKIGQVSFWVPDGEPSKPYISGYTLHNKPHYSRHSRKLVE